jgi:hypothetical protein
MKDRTGGYRSKQGVPWGFAFMAGFLIAWGSGIPTIVNANPSGPTVAAGQATISGLGSLSGADSTTDIQGHYQLEPI